MKPPSGFRFFEFEMRFDLCGRDAGYAAAKDLRDNQGGVVGAVDAKIGELVRNDALGVQRAETGFIAEQWTARHGHATREKNFNAGVEPDDRDAGVAEKFGSARLRVGSAAEGKHSGFLIFHGATKGGAEFISFELAKGGFAVPFKKLWNGDVGGGFDAFVEIDKAPSELPSKPRGDGAFAGAHKSSEADDGNARERATRCGRWIHDDDERLAAFIELSKEYSGESESQSLRFGK